MDKYIGNEESPSQIKEKVAEYIKLTERDHCAMATAFSRKFDFVERIKNEQVAIKSTDKTNLIGLIRENLKQEQGFLKITPETSAIYLMAVGEEEEILKKLSPRVKLGACDHLPSDHLAAFDSIKQSIDELSNSRPN